MSEQLYYTWSSIGSGSSTGERIRAWSSGVGSVNSAPVQALRPYLLYKLPSGSASQTTPDEAPISLTYAKTDYHRLLVQRVYAGKDGVGRPGNLFSHAILLNPEEVSIRDAIRLWRSDLWMTAEDQIPTKSTTIASLTPQEITQYIRSDWTFTVDQQTVFDWLPTIFHAFLRLKKLNKKQLYLAAPADMVAALIWCITRCLPRSLDIMRELTFSTYEHDVTKSPVTIVGTCWLPPANHQGTFTPSGDLPSSCYLEIPSNTILAINYYKSKKTPFSVEEPVQKFVNFATQSLRDNNTKDLNTLIGQAERKKIQDIGTFLIPFHILNEVPTESTIKQVLMKQELWWCLQFTTIRDKLLELFQEQRAHWQRWWETEGRIGLQKIHQYAKENTLSEETIALNHLAKALLNELISALTNQQTHKVSFWDQTLKDCSSLESAPDLWITFPERFAGLAYTSTYQSWWEQSDKQIIRSLVITTITRPQLTNKQKQDLQNNLQQWWDQSTERLKGAWIHLYGAESEFWVNQLSDLNPPHNGDSNWLTLLNELDRIRPQDKAPVSMCYWKTYITLMESWLKIGQIPSDAWFTIPWQNTPDLLAIPDSEFPVEWKYITLQVKILFPQSPTTQMLNDVARSAPLIHQVLAQLIQDDQRRQYAVAFCISLLQHNYLQREQLLVTILPEIFPYEQEKQLIADAALLTSEQLNSYAETIIYKHLTTSREIPDWLLSALRGYFTYFRPTTINPDRQTDWKQSQPISTILNSLIKYDQQLLRDVYPYISFWYDIHSLFQQQNFYFDAYKLKDINNRINQIKLLKTTHAELREELLSFLVNRIKTEPDLVRVIDHLQDALMPELPGYDHKTMAIHKEITRLVGELTKKQGANIAKTIVYIKVMLNDAISLRNLNTQPQTIDPFVNECLNNLLSPLNEGQIRDIKPTPHQWSESISKEWEGYLNVYKAQRQLAKNSGFTPPWSRSSSTPTTNKATSTTSAYTPSTSNTPPQTNTHFQGNNENAVTYYPKSLQGPTSQSSNQNQFRPPPTPQRPIVLPASHTAQPTQDQTQNKYMNNDSARESALQKLQKAFDTQQVDKIAAAYDQQLDPWILPLQTLQRARAAKQLIAAHVEGKKTGNWDSFIRLFNEHQRDFKMSDEIKRTYIGLKGQTDR